jgi:hypothetical protein
MAERPSRQPEKPWYRSDPLKVGVTLAILTWVLGNVSHRFDTWPFHDSKAPQVALTTFTTDSPPVLVENFRYTLLAVKCGTHKRSEDGVTVKAQGQFCIVDFDVVNVSETASDLFVRAKLNVDSEQYPLSPSALFDNIFPHAARHVEIVFDIPESREPTAIVLGDTVPQSAATLPLHLRQPLPRSS